MDHIFVSKLTSTTAHALKARASGNFRSNAYSSGVSMFEGALYGAPAGADYAAEKEREFKGMLMEAAEAGHAELTFNTYAWGTHARQGFADELTSLYPGLSAHLEGKTVKARWPAS